MDFDREWLVPLDRADARVLVRQGGRPVAEYAVVLQLGIHGQWRTIRLIDNAHGRAHMHRYAGESKVEGVPFLEGDPREVLPKAIAYLVATADPIIASYQP